MELFCRETTKREPKFSLSQGAERRHTGGFPTTPLVNPTSPVPPITTGPKPTTTSGAWCIATPLDLYKWLWTMLVATGTNCSAIQPSRECWDPNTLVDHASYAFNDYYHKNPVPTSCVFGGAAQITNTDTSHGSCRFPVSTNTPTTPPRAPTTPSSAPMVLPPPSPITTFDPYLPDGDSGDEDYGLTGEPNQAGTATSSLVLLITCLVMPLSMARHI